MRDLLYELYKTPLVNQCKRLSGRVAGIYARESEVEM